jgi:hypothetical protein
MEDGRLIRVGKYRGDTNAIIYIVAISNPTKAVNLIRENTANTADEIQDLGRVSANLLAALKAAAGRVHSHRWPTLSAKEGNWAISCDARLRIQIHCCFEGSLACDWPMPNPRKIEPLPRHLAGIIPR